MVMELRAKFSISRKMTLQRSEVPAHATAIRKKKRQKSGQLSKMNFAPPCDKRE